MIEYEGKYNKAVFMGSELDESTTTQLYSFLNHPAFENSKIVIQPDAHAGSGVCVGFTMTMNKYIIPAVIGVDIACGVEVWNLNIKPKKWKEHRLKSLDEFIRENLPAGTGVVREIPLTEKEINKFSSGLYEKIVKTCEKMSLDKTRVIKGLGSLGSGNHYVAVECDENSWLNIHSGSRWFGYQVAAYHQDIARKNMKDEFKGASAFRGLEYLTEETGLQSYVDDMMVAQEYASLNRKTMARLIIEQHFDKDMDAMDHIESVHNYINFEDKIIRKGAISAHEGERVIIPLNMRDGSILGVGKGNEDWNFSAPHGAGRKMSRTQAKKQITLSTYRSQITGAGIYSSCVSKKTLDEAPDAYKRADVILNSVGDSVEITSQIKPVYNFKG